jgi:hypothetical protein
MERTKKAIKYYTGKLTLLQLMGLLAGLGLVLTWALWFFLG